MKMGGSHWRILEGTKETDHDWDVLSMLLNGCFPVSPSFCLQELFLLLIFLRSIYMLQFSLITKKLLKEHYLFILYATSVFFVWTPCDLKVSMYDEIFFQSLVFPIFWKKKSFVYQQSLMNQQKTEFPNEYFQVFHFAWHFLIILRNIVLSLQ